MKVPFAFSVGLKANSVQQSSTLDMSVETVDHICAWNCTRCLGQFELRL